jgi:hypothetical protein
MMTRVRAVALSFALWVTAGTASAVSVAWAFQGTLQVMTDDPVPSTLEQLGVQVGAPVQGFLRFDPSTPNATPTDPSVGRYLGAIDVAGLTIGGWSLARSVYVPDPTQTVADWIVTDLGAGGSGEFSEVDMVDPTGTYVSSSILALELQARDTTAFVGHPLVAAPPSLASLVPFGYDPTSFYGYGTDLALIETTFGGLHTTFRIELTSVEGVPVTPPLPVALPGGIPEPSSVCLVALGLLPLVRRCADILRA